MWYILCSWMKRYITTWRCFQISLTSFKILNIMMCYLSFAGLMNKMTGKKGNMRGKGLFHLTYFVEENQVRDWRHKLNWAMISWTCLPHTAPDYLPRSGILYTGVGFPISIINQENCALTYLQANLMDTILQVRLPLHGWVQVTFWSWLIYPTHIQIQNNLKLILK